MGVGIHAGLGAVVDGCGQVWAYMGKVGKGGQVWMDQTDQAGIGGMAIGWVWLCVQM